MMTLKALGIAGAAAFGAVVWMASDREPCKNFSAIPVPAQVLAGVPAGNQLVVTFNYPRFCEMDIIQDSMRWRMIDSSGRMINFDPDPSKLLPNGNGGNPIGVVARVPNDATLGGAKFRISMSITKNPLQQYLNWPVDMTASDVPFTIVSPDTEQKELPNG